LGRWRGVIAPVTLIAEIINRFAPHVPPWRPNFLEDGAGAVYGIGVHRTLSGAPHLVRHGWASQSPANRPAVQAVEGGRGAPLSRSSATAPVMSSTLMATIQTLSPRSLTQMAIRPFSSLLDTNTV
jgi:hypothetical protein